MRRVSIYPSYGPDVHVRWLLLVCAWCELNGIQYDIIMSLLERCPRFRGCYVQSPMELGPEDVSLLERCPHFRGC